jgi:hypothetical protein
MRERSLNRIPLPQEDKKNQEESRPNEFDKWKWNEYSKLQYRCI